MHAPVLAILTLLFALRVLGQAFVVFFYIDWLPSSEHWFSGLIRYPILLGIQLVMLAGMVKVASDIWRATGVAKPRPEWARFLLVCSLIYAGSMILRYVLAMIYRPEMRWFGGTIPIFFHFVLAGFLYTWGGSIHKAAIQPGFRSRLTMCTDQGASRSTKLTTRC